MNLNLMTLGAASAERGCIFLIIFSAACFRFQFSEGGDD